MTTEIPENGRFENSHVIVEIGWPQYFSRAYPTTTAIWTVEEDPISPLPPNVREFNLREFWRLLRQRGISLIVIYPPTRHPPWSWRSLRSVFHFPFRPWRRFIRLFGIQAVRFLPREIPVFVVDGDDMRTIPKCNIFLLDRCSYYFKRELPIDRWQVFQKTLHPEMPSTRFRRHPRNRRRIMKLRPWAIGFPSDSPKLPAENFPGKTIDVFVALEVTNSSTVRIEGITELKKLAACGLRIFIAEQRMPREDFLQMMSRAWLTWSPEGFGWDCIRHYEAAAMYSVPVMNHATIVRYHPLLNGVHALYYDADVPGSLTQIIGEALGNLDGLKKMAIMARAHVETYHLTPWSRVEQLLHYRSGAENPPGGLNL